jgi:gas vesicle GvpC-like protein
VSLKQQWDAAREQRLNGILERQQQVLQHRQETAEFLSTTTAERAAMSAALHQNLNSFYTSLKNDVANFLLETRTNHEAMWFEQRKEREAYVTAMRDYVWGSAPAFIPGDSFIGVSFTPISPSPSILNPTNILGPR